MRALKIGAVIVLLMCGVAAQAAPEDQIATPSPTPSCAAGLETRLIVYERGRVVDDEPSPLNLREGPSTNDDIIARIPSGDIFFVLEGPHCSGVYAWYRVQYEEDEGWIAEGTGDRYFAEPYLPG